MSASRPTLISTRKKNYKIMVGFHGHDQTSDPDEFSTPDTCAGHKGASPYIGVNLNIGHFVAAGGDPVAYIREHHQKIVTCTSKTARRTRRQLALWPGRDAHCGGSASTADNKWKIPANIEYEYGDGKNLDSVAEVKSATSIASSAGKLTSLLWRPKSQNRSLSLGEWAASVRRFHQPVSRRVRVRGYLIYTSSVSRRLAGGADMRFSHVCDSATVGR